jgi:cysteine desulfuration protein SufE
MHLDSADELTLGEIRESLDFFDDPYDRQDYLLDLGQKLPAMPGSEKTERNRVHGCQSQAWLSARLDERSGRMVFHADADSHITKGVLTVLLAIVAGKTPQEVLETDFEGLIRDLGLSQLVSPLRRNGLFGAVKRIRDEAARAAA